MRKRRVPCLARLDSRVTVPGSKSHTARALIIGALASGQTVLKDPLLAEDTEYMIRGLKALGVRMTTTSRGVVIQGTGGRLSPPAKPIFLGGAGTAVRFLTTLSGLCGGHAVIDGSPRMRERPIQDLLDALKPLGIDARSIPGTGCPPVAVEGGRFRGGKTSLRGSTSSQFLSSILLAGPYAESGVEVDVDGDVVSRSYINLTMTTMRDFGVEVTHDDYRVFRVPAGSYSGRPYTIEGDLSSASYFFAAAAITGGRIRVDGINPATEQGDKGLLDVLEAMGCRVRWEGRFVEVTGGSLSGIDVEMKTMPDAVPTIAVVAAFAKGTTRISGVGHLRFKETDRLAVLERELDKLGIEAKAEGDSLAVRGGNPRGAEIDPSMDHRMAMAFAVAGLRTPGIVIRNADCVSKSFPGFWRLLEGLG
ncbi:MAG: 3-phosphoshikimate 1-carboxyvinyltransferase [Deltaproteobacteria bacterium]|nr:3-phosphoshikimate 1-carboxyvinyltransferase [Deltaproteobacteria bacterium]